LNRHLFTIHTHVVSLIKFVSNLSKEIGHKGQEYERLKSEKQGLLKFVDRIDNSVLFFEDIKGILAYLHEKHGIFVHFKEYQKNSVKLILNLKNVYHIYGPLIGCLIEFLRKIHNNAVGEYASYEESYLMLVALANISFD